MTHRVAILALCLLALPALAQEPPADPTDNSPILCREPQKQTLSRIMPPKVCRTTKQWDDLHARGLDIAADGKSLVPLNKFEQLNTRACGSGARCGL